MRLAEFAWSRAELAPGTNVLAGFVEHHYAIVAVPVADVDVAIRSERDVIGLIHVGLVGARYVGSADGHQHLAIQRELAYGLGAGVDDPEPAGAVETDRMRILEEAVLPPGGHQLAFGREDLDRDLAAVEGPDIAVGSDGDARHRAPLAAGRLLFGPTGICFIADRNINARIGRHVGGGLSQRNGRAQGT